MKRYLKCVVFGFMIFMLSACTIAPTNQVPEKTLIVDDGVIKYVNEGVLEDVISLEDLIANNNNTSSIEGKEVEIFIQDEYIVWKYKGESSTNKIIAVKDLVGKQGISGLNGKDGINGTNGKDGVNGVDGKDGKDGTNGKDGSNGLDGKDGINGTDGKDGTNGVDGKDGTNAYIWVKYLDNDPNVSSNNELKDTSSAYMGIYYGTSETAPMNISNYNWYKTKGDKGDTGEKGDKGDTGIQGPQGIQGVKGDTGANGDKGDKGEKGDTGAKGDKGDKGDSYIDSVAIFKYTMSSYVLELEQLYKGNNINVSKSNNAICFGDNSDYVIEIEGFAYLKAENNNNTHELTLILKYGGADLNIFYKKLSNKSETYTGNFYYIKESTNLIYPSSRVATGLSDWHTELTIKIYKK